MPTRPLILFDPEPLCQLPAGIGIYTLRLMQQLARITDDLTLAACYATANRQTRQDLRRLLKKETPGICLHTLPLPGRLAHLLPSCMACRFHSPPFSTPALFHATSYLAPPWALRFNCPQVLTIHDLAFLRELGDPFGPPAYTEMLRKRLPVAARKAAVILAVSEFTKREVVGLLGVPEEKIAVTPIATQWENATSPIPEEEDALFLHGRNLATGGYILSVGQLSPRKNFGTLLEAFEHFRQKQPDARLVIVGRPGWNTQELVRRLETGIPGVTWIQECNSDELRTLYRHARAFFLVSWYEGFGIPLLEAMQCGCPTCYATGSSMDEIAGDAGLAVHPGDTPGITEAMSGLWNNRTLADDLRGKGLRRAANFSWSRTAVATLEAYRKALAHENRH